METTRRFQTKGDAVPDSVQPIHKQIEQSPTTSKSDSIQYTLCPIGLIGLMYWRWETAQQTTWCSRISHGSRWRKSILPFHILLLISETPQIKWFRTDSEAQYQFPGLKHSTSSTDSLASTVWQMGNFYVLGKPLLWLERMHSLTRIYRTTCWIHQVHAFLNRQVMESFEGCSSRILYDATTDLQVSLQPWDW